VPSPCIFAIESTYARFPQNPSPQSMDIVVFIPRQLVPTVGQLCIGGMASPASNLVTSGSSASRKSIHFGSFSFIPYSSKLLLTYSSLHWNVQIWCSRACASTLALWEYFADDSQVDRRRSIVLPFNIEKVVKPTRS
jgi:hypothetical protein